MLPEFEHPNALSSEDLIAALILNRLVPEYSGYSTIIGRDVQLTAKLIFGPDLKELEHGHVNGIYLWDEEKEVYSLYLGAAGSYAKTKVIAFNETEQEFIVDAIHLFYYFPPDGMEGDTYVAGEFSRMSDYAQLDDFYKNAFRINNYQEVDLLIAENTGQFPVRRYILVKEENGVCYIRKSLLLKYCLLLKNMFLLLFEKAIKI